MGRQFEDRRRVRGRWRLLRRSGCHGGRRQLGGGDADQRTEAGPLRRRTIASIKAVVRDAAR